MQILVFSCVLSDKFYFYMIHFTSINRIFLTIQSIKGWAFHLEEHETEIRIILADAAGWYQITSLSLTVLMFCEDSDALCIWAFSFYFSWKKLYSILPRLASFWSVRIPYCIHSVLENKAGFKERFGASLTCLVLGCL